MRAAINDLNYTKRDHNGFERSERVFSNGQSFSKEANIKPTIVASEDGKSCVSTAQSAYDNESKVPLGVREESSNHSHPVNDYTREDQNGKTWTVPAGTHTTERSEEDNFEGLEFATISGNLGENEGLGASFYLDNSKEANYSLGENALNSITAQMEQKELTAKIAEEIKKKLEGTVYE